MGISKIKSVIRKYVVHKPTLYIDKLCVMLVVFMLIYSDTLSSTYASNDIKNESYKYLAVTNEINTEIKQPKLHALSACLYDATGGRVLYGKNENDKMPNASTTKIMTLIVAIEYGNMDDIVNVSKYAASMPEVKMKIHEAQKFYLRDLLYAMMLESYNDVSVAIAEHIAGTTEAFADMMNEKAMELGCNNTFFVTPNGLDKKSNDGINEHGTTSRDLSVIMSYCINNPEFLRITQTKKYSFYDVLQNTDGKVIKGNSRYEVNNKNKLLYSMKELISGKTGFTGKAGYCYVCAVKKKDRLIVISLLACGWPNNKNYKWEDTKKLIEYCDKYYENRIINKNDIKLQSVIVKNGVLSDKLGDVEIKPMVKNTKKNKAVV